MTKLDNGTPVINLFDYDSDKLIKSFTDSDGLNFFKKDKLEYVFIELFNYIELINNKSSQIILLFDSRYNYSNQLRI
jgi:hypothetical protein